MYDDAGKDRAYIKIMNMKKRKALLISVLTGALTACGGGQSKPATEALSDASAKPASNPPGETVTTPKLVINTESPDSTVKSWWAYLDESEKYSHDVCNATRNKSTDLFKDAIQQVSTGTLKDYLERKDCLFYTYERVIDSVMVESGTRAAVFATIKNSTPIPAGAIPDKYDTEWRMKGSKFKYIVEKIDGGWRISEVYAKSGTDNDWVPQYKGLTKPSFPSYVPPHQ